MTRDELIETAGQRIIDAYEAYAPVPAVLRSEAANIALALANNNLLHDHAGCLEINRGWQEYKHRKVEERRKLVADRHALETRIFRLRVQLEARRDQLEGGLVFANEAQLIDTLLAALQGDQPTEPEFAREHLFALGVARSAVLKAARKFASAADRYRRRDLVHSVQQMIHEERACVRVAKFLADEIGRAQEAAPPTGEADRG